MLNGWPTWRDNSHGVVQVSPVESFTDAPPGLERMTKLSTAGGAGGGGGGACLGFAGQPLKRKRVPRRTIVRFMSW